MRKKIVAGNWKMNKTLEEGQSLTSEVKHMAEDELPGDVQLILCPPFIHLSALHGMLKGSPIGLGAQNCSEQESGAYTGETSVAMLQSVGVKYVILGHSERREQFKESNELLAKKLDVALKQGLVPIFCCGEPLEIREREAQDAYVQKQIEESLFHLSKEDVSKIIVAYEPIWAIGTGKTASAEQAQEMHAVIRKQIASKYGQDVADAISILYGGSVKPDNAREIFAGEDVDGGLIGGASLKSRDFIDIAKSFS
ncbi:triose-phosphate isomerase [Catalinimonas niigatensis]|uniref:triose-phosphate isomerase n=1 Tax=Catalinimonas niigatensis TaxID=1397264 RepID=UPI0026655AFF|nr:triose-phosphate isomerase [Catalinimonas niigatensis]WPP48085.1 triose-phosphate isomerase [Catalinimonas niigatensis]